ncbi:INO80B [Acanthosepion pharaonis]|uniref:INO80B n=1 Tax=Acanthosepion pharaonis TaxID=158019 RepID=A0A812EZ86_ACAPH|nr:INO80B [Sepia pharaonis]
MGKKKDQANEEDTTDSPVSHKKHKKHKKKHKKRKEEEETSPVTHSNLLSDSKPSIKLKIRLGGETLSSKKFVLKDDSNVSVAAFPLTTTSSSVSRTTKPVVSKVATVAKEEHIDVEVDDTQLPDPLASAIHPGFLDPNSIISGILAPSIYPWANQEDAEESLEPEENKEEISNEEQAWLDALEAGELDDFGEIRKPKDPNLLTARQRALLHGKQEQELLELPTGYKTVELTEEQIQRRQQRAKKRRQQAQEKREKDKKQTLERLLKKQETKSKGPKIKSSKRLEIPRYRYVNGVSGIFISMPFGFDFPVSTVPIQEPSKVPMCGVRNCTQPKKYSCSKTGVPLCSLQCYKKNLLIHKLVM